MGASALPVILFTLIWGGVAGSGYWVPEGPHKKLLQVGHTVTARGLRLSLSFVCYFTCKDIVSKRNRQMYC